MVPNRWPRAAFPHWVLDGVHHNPFFLVADHCT
jgi:hypothetical protein